MKRIIILHEYGAPEHFRGLQQFANENKTKFELSYTEFRIMKNIIKGIIKHDGHKVIKNIRNIGSIISLLFKKNEIVVLGMAPYDGFVVIANMIQRNHYVIYYSSWPYWDHSQYPKKVWFLKKFVDMKWKEFTRGVRFVGVIKQGVNNFVYENSCKGSWVIPHSFDTSIYFPSRKKIIDELLKVIFVGRLVPEKGIKFIIDAICSPDLQGNFEFTFIGDGDEDIIRQIKVLESSKSNVKYRKRINDQKIIASEYRDNDIILLPSYKTEKWEELFGMVLIEAMACGVVPIVTDCIGPKNIVTDGRDGLMIEQKSTRAIIEALNILMKNKKLYFEMNENAIRKAQEYSVDSCAEKWLSVIDDIISSEEHRNV